MAERINNSSFLFYCLYKKFDEYLIEKIIFLRMTFFFMDVHQVNF